MRPRWEWDKTENLLSTNICKLHDIHWYTRSCTLTNTKQNYKCLQSFCFVCTSPVRHKSNLEKSSFRMLFCVSGFTMLSSMDCQCQEESAIEKSNFLIEKRTIKSHNSYHSIWWMSKHILISENRVNFSSLSTCHTVSALFIRTQIAWFL